MNTLRTPDVEMSAHEQMGMTNAMMILLRLAPKSIDQLPVHRIAFTDELMLDLGHYAPQEALENLEKTQPRPELLRWLVLGAMLHNPADTERLFKQLHPRLIANDDYAMVAGRVSARNPELYWVRAAEKQSPKLARQAAWQLAHDLLRSSSSDGTSFTVLPMVQHRESQLIDMAYAIRNFYPQLTRAVAAEQVPKLIQQIESDSARPYARSPDLRIACFLEPELILKMFERVDIALQAELKIQATQRTAVVRAQGNKSMKISCAKGLLVDVLDEPDF